jgi:hypothetical protein
MALTDVVGVNPEGLFDPAKYTTAGQPHLTEHLWAEYRLHLQRLLDARKAAGQPAADIDTAVSKAPASHFYAFCVEYLLRNRPVTTFFVDTNMGVVLTNTKRLVLSPGFDLRGTMQNAGAVGVTEGLSQPGMDGVTRAGGGPIGII